MFCRIAEQVQALCVARLKTAVLGSTLCSAMGSPLSSSRIHGFRWWTIRSCRWQIAPLWWIFFLRCVSNEGRSLKSAHFAQRAQMDRTFVITEHMEDRP